MYNVLWFDDQHDSLPIIKESAHINDIFLHGVSNAQDGIRLLEENFIKYDAVIVDGLFYRNANQHGEISSEEAFLEVARKLDKIQAMKIIPWFILSGQTSFTTESNPSVNVYRGGKVYDKLSNKSSDDLNSLWSDLKNEVNQETQIFRNHESVFSFFTNDYLGEKYRPVLLNAIKLCNKLNSVDFEELRNSFVPLRKIIEQLFRYLNEIGIVPDEVYNGSGSFNKTSIYLSGIPDKYKIKEGLIPPVIGFLLKQVTQITQDSAHDIPGKLNLYVDNYIHQNKSTYLYRSTLYQLLELLEWFKKFVDICKQNGNDYQYWTIKDNKVRQSDSVWLKGSIIRIALNGFGTFKPDDESPEISIIPNDIRKLDLKEKDIILVTCSEVNDKMKRHITDIKKI